MIVTLSTGIWNAA